MPVIQPMMIENNQGGGGGKDPNWNFNSNKGQQGHYAPFKKMMFKNTDLSEKMKSRELLLKNLPTLRSDSSQNQDSQHEHVYEQDKPNQMVGEVREDPNVRAYMLEQQGQAWHQRVIRSANDQSDPNHTQARQIYTQLRLDVLDRRTNAQGHRQFQAGQHHPIQGTGELEDLFEGNAPIRSNPFRLSEHQQQNAQRNQPQPERRYISIFKGPRDGMNGE